LSASRVRASVTGAARALIGVQRLSHDHVAYVDVVTSNVCKPSTGFLAQ
jgi:hypothetical protein